MWRSIRRSPFYEVSEDGEVRSSRTRKLLIPSDNGHGILKVNLSEQGEKVTVSVARLVADEFMAEPEEGEVIFYVDGNSHNVSVENLQWRQRWFAQEWAAQSKRLKPLRPWPIKVRPRDGDPDDWTVYENSLVCAKAMFSIEKYIVLACGRGDYIYNRSIYEWIKK